MKKNKLLNRAICVAFFPLLALAGNALAEESCNCQSAYNSPLPPPHKCVFDPATISIICK
ncbi:hypothetical protein ALP38_200037 [Pseudomonas amygdali pv. sesami]|nr:hypothetical protein ALO93_200073 [Pseudomonas amygdali pv. sesami]RMT92287.1 hypothetical protein ALP38_200037 [Pseudomonas amygdali pv. sesami]RMV78578.1 hypothetical protein ALP04_200002 [Pseudomonas amygdali pv. sesami]